MRRASTMLILMLASCDYGWSEETDAPVDARPIDGPGGPGPRPESCVPGPKAIRCMGDQITFIQYNVPRTPLSGCSMPPSMISQTCASGCAVEGFMQWGLWDTPWPPAQSFCANAPEVQVGASCGFCFPTRAVLAADGTVESMTYLRCESGTCAATTAPFVAGFLQSCGAAVVAPHQSPGVNGFVFVTGSQDQYCLIAWDSATSTVRSGLTRQCMGDWYCPEGSLCDDDIARLDASPKVGVCKPGPRGTLTPAMLAP